MNQMLVLKCFINVDTSVLSEILSLIRPVYPVYCTYHVYPAYPMYPAYPPYPAYLVYMVRSGLTRLLGFWVGFDGQNQNLAGSSFSGSSDRLKALRPYETVVKMAIDRIKLSIIFICCSRGHI